MDLLLILLAIIIIIGIIWYIKTLNNLNVAIVKIEEADSGIDIALTKRYNVLTKMLDVTNTYAKHEVKIMTEIVNLRTGMTIKEKITENNKMSEVFSKLNVIAESYPELKSSEVFQKLQISIADVEEHLQAARRLYNSNVSSYNQLIVKFPISIVANSKNLTKKEFFEAEKHKRNDVEIKIKK